MQRAWFSLLIFLFLSMPALADDRVSHGSWSSQFLDGMGEATTHENGTSTFGILCAQGSCRYYFANGIDCEPSGNYPFMITTDAGALTIEGVCEPVPTPNGDILVYWFNENDAMNRAFQQTPVVGFAFPLTNGKFRLSSFSMEGFNEAIQRMVSGLRERSDSPASSQQQDLQMEIQEATPEPAGST
ncbi:MAG: hypothetical protein ACKOAO_02130 [Oxalobacteraceae bacterium]